MIVPQGMEAQVGGRCPPSFESGHRRTVCHVGSFRQPADRSSDDGSLEFKGVSALSHSSGDCQVPVCLCVCLFEL